ncbi:MAG: aminopeptidase P family protein [Chloroflexi bacterium]|nr:MAG: aminopeptidase P family protein [Chloroflexota bacterium]
MAVVARLPRPDDFAPPPTAADLRRWDEADAAALPKRIAALRAHMAGEGVDALLLTSHADARYFTGMRFGPNDEPTAGSSGWTLVTADRLAILVDSRYTVQARHEAPQAEAIDYGSDAGAAVGTWVARGGARRLALDPHTIRHAVWERIAATTPGVELLAARGWGVQLRATKEAAEIERIAAACAVADRALAGLLPQIRPGTTEAALAWSLERAMREGGAEALAFDVAALAGGNAALPHGNPGERALRAGEVILFDFGAQVAGYRSDMTRTLFLGEPSAEDREIYLRVLRGQSAAIELLQGAISDHATALPSGRAADEAARAAIGSVAGVYDHGLGHGIGLQTHESPSLSRGAATDPLPSPTVFSVEPGIYIEERIGVRIEDLVAVDLAAGRLERLTRFPSDPIVLG